MRRSGIVLAICLTIFTVGIAGLQWKKYQSFGYNGLDLGIYTQTVWSLAHGHGFANSIHDPSYLGDHYELILIPIGALYRLWSSPLLLLWMQTLAIAASGWCIYRIAQRRLGAWAGVTAAGIWLAHPFIYNVAMYEFHALTLALPLLLAAILAYQQQRWATWAILLGVTCLVREDLPLIAISWGALAALDRVPRKWWAGIGGFGLVWFVISHLLIANANALGDYKFVGFIAWLGSRPIDMATFPFRHPMLFLQHVFAINNWGTFFGLMAAFGLLPFLQMRKLIPAALSFAQLLLIGSSPVSILHLHYVVPFIPFLAWAAISALEQRQAFSLGHRVPREISGALLIILAVVSPLYFHLAFGPIEQPWQPRRDADRTRSAALRGALAVIRPTDRVATTFSTLPSLSNRPAIYSLNYVYLGKRQYTEAPYKVPSDLDAVVIDWKQFYEFQYFYRDTLFLGQTGEQRIRTLLESQGLRLAYLQDSVAVYRRDGNLPEDFVVIGKPSTATATTITRVEAWQTTTQLMVKIWWSGGKRPTEPMSIRLRQKTPGGVSQETTRIIGEGGWPMSSWDERHEWITTYRLPVLSGQSVTTLDYSWGSMNGAFRLDRWRTFTPVTARVTIFESGSTTIGH